MDQNICKLFHLDINLILLGDLSMLQGFWNSSISTRIRLLLIPGFIDLLRQLSYLPRFISSNLELINEPAVVDHGIFFNDLKQMRQIHQIQIQILHILRELRNHCLDLPLGKEHHISVVL